MAQDSIFNFLNSSCKASTRASLNETHIACLNIAIPKDDILKKFSKIANEIIDKILKIKKENQKLANLRDFLLPMLMNGQVGFKGN